MENGLKWLCSVILGSMAMFFGQYGLFIVLVAAAVVLDVATGLVKAKATGEGLSSDKASKGFWKKISLFAALAFGIFLDYAAATVLSQVGVKVGVELPFALIICAYIIINEAISISENLYLTNPESFPGWIANLLKVAKDKIKDESMRN
ncbi:MAG: phage holin family protein [Clostridia bacterium]|nr:phage holin family protein [Clostridia bacterium]